MAFDVPTTRGCYTSLSDGWTYLNGGGCAQVPERVLSAMSTAFRAAPKALPGETGTGSHSRVREAGMTAGTQFATMARGAFADVVGGRPEGVVLGPSRDVLVQNLAHALGRRLRLGTGMVLPRSGDAVLQVPFRRAADMFGARVRYAEADLSTGAVPAWQYDSLVDGDTRLVVVPAADPFVGAVAPVREIVSRVRASSPALVLADVSSYAPYRVVDMNRLGADVLLVDASAWGGPEVSALVFRDPAQLDRMASLSLLPDARGVDRLEVSPVAPALLGGVSESVRHLADLDPSARGTRRNRIASSMPQVAAYLQGLMNRLIDALGNLDQVYIVGEDGDGAEDTADVADRVPRVSFVVTDVPATTVVRRLLDNNLVTSAVRPGESALLEAMGVMEAGGAVTVGLQPFNTPHDVDQLVRAVASLR